MYNLKHQNILNANEHFFERDIRSGEIYGLIVMDLATSDLYDAIIKYESENQIIDHF
jgi:hypothetical protein